nr:DcuS/MalK family sensor histidine kinase [Jeotgalibacillus malaysiensis]
MKKPKLSLSTTIIFFVLLVVFLSLLITDLLITRNTSNEIQEQLEEKALIVSRTVAESQVVKSELLTDEIEGTIQDYANSILEASDMLFIVVMDTDGIRQSHPNADIIGEQFVGGDEERVLNGEEYVSVSEGTLGFSVRAFTPIYDDNGSQIGAVSTGISLSAVEATLSQNHRNILLGSLIGSLVGILGAILLARYIKRSLFGLEPAEIARIYEERNRMFQSVKEGIVAVDADGRLTLVNKSAKDIFMKAGIDDDDPIGKHVTDYLPDSRLKRVLETGESEVDEEQELNGTTIIVNRVPLVVGGQVAGAISTFRDKTEVNRLAEQLTGVRLYADSLRAQSHEFKNKLHVLLGMVEMGSYEEVKQYLKQLSAHQVHETESVTNKIKDPVLAGFMIGKLSYAREQQVELTLQCETEIPPFRSAMVTHELVTIIGNLLDNAIESLQDRPKRKVDIAFSYIDELLSICVKDTGKGMDEALKSMIFTKGISTKGYNRGYGLHLVHASVKALDGSIEIDSEPDRGTVVHVILPLEMG